MNARNGKAVYLDVCALGRPYDDQRLIRIAMEAAAVQLILVHVKAGRYVLYYSPVHEHEILGNPDGVVGSGILALLHTIGTDIVPLVKGSDIEKQGRTLIAAGMGVADAFHVAHAQQTHAAFVTCDDRLIKKCRTLAVDMWCGTPVEFCARENLI